MDRKEFGKLVAALRKSKQDEYFHELTQAGLAKQAGISEQVIGKVERGGKVSIEPDLLLRLAQAFRLSPRERREFFLAAIGLGEEDIPGQQPPDEQVFDELFNTLAQVSLPAFLVDSYDNENPEPYLQQSIYFFNTITLPVRATEYYQYLLSGFKKDREMALFNTLYHYEISDENQNHHFEGEQFTVRHHTLGEMRFYSPPIFPVATSKGSLYLVTYIPASPETVQACATLARACGQGAAHLADWPEKLIPEIS